MSKLDIKTTHINETVDTVDKTFGSKKEIQEYFATLDQQKTTETKNVVEEFQEDLHGVKDIASMYLAIRETLQDETAIKNSSKAWYKVLEFATNDWAFHLEMQDSLVDETYQEVANRQNTQVKERLKKEKETEIRKDKESWYILTEQDQADINKIEQELQIGSIALSQKDAPSAAESPVEEKWLWDTITWWFSRWAKDLTEEWMEAKTASIEKELSWFAKIFHMVTSGEMITKIFWSFTKAFKKKDSPVAATAKEVVEETVDAVV